MLIDELKSQMFAAMKAKETVTKEILRTVIGEVTSTGEDATDERVLSVIRKMLKSNQETLDNTADAEGKAVLEAEMQTLRQFVPQTLTPDAIAQALMPVADAIRGAGNDGQATGMAMKHLKTVGAAVDGKDVATAVKQLRA